MEEILASIRRIIADDEAKPPRREAGQPGCRQAEPPAQPPVMKDVPPSAIAPAPKPAAPKPAPRHRRRRQSRRQQQPRRHRRDAREPRSGNARGRREAARSPTATYLNLPTRWRCRIRRRRASFSKSSRRTISNSPKRAPPGTPAAGLEPPPFESERRRRNDAVALDRVRGGIRFNTLANTVLSNNARTLEDLVKEMLRPMLKSWLDDNLPGLVERIVKAEIERVSRGR